MNKVYSEDERRWRIIAFKVLERHITNAFEVFRANGIEPVLIKGWAISQKYPEKYIRFFSDIDLAVAPEEYQKAAELLKKNHLTIDLHEGLRHLDTVEWHLLFDRSITRQIGEADIRILSEEDHLRVLCVHWLTDGGQYSEKLWDIYYAVENRSKGFEWEKCLGAVTLRRKLWIIYTIGLAHKYLNLNIENLYFREEAEHIPKWLIKTVEKEWASDVRLRPIHTCLNDWREVLRQIIKRIPPNPIQSTIENEGDFDETSRVKYQLKSVVKRLMPSIRRVAAVTVKRK